MSLLSRAVHTTAFSAGLLLAASAGLVQAAEDVTVIELTQTGCQFIESEGGIDHGYTPTGKADCEEINAQTEGERIGDDNTLHLSPASTSSASPTPTFPICSASTCVPRA